MSAGAVSRRAFMSIGEVLAQLRPDFPDVTISKIRFLESEGLIEPERSSGNYRKFSREDVARLRYVLGAQRDQYLPLRVIKDHLEALDRGLEPGSAGPRVPRALVAADSLPSPESFVRDATDIRLSRQELLSTSKLDEAQLTELESYGLLAARHGAYYDGNALLVATTIAEMARFGIGARHLRPFKAAADREIGLVEQVLAPLRRQRNPEAQARAEEAERELASLSVRLHAALVRSGLHSGDRP